MAHILLHCEAPIQTGISSGSAEERECVRSALACGEDRDYAMINRTKRRLHKWYTDTIR